MGARDAAAIAPASSLPSGAYALTLSRRYRRHPASKFHSSAPSVSNPRYRALGKSPGNPRSVSGYTNVTASTAAPSEHRRSVTRSTSYPLSLRSTNRQSSSAMTYATPCTSRSYLSNDGSPGVGVSAPSSAPSAPPLGSPARSSVPRIASHSRFSCAAASAPPSPETRSPRAACTSPSPAAHAAAMCFPFSAAPRSPPPPSGDPFDAEPPNTTTRRETSTAADSATARALPRRPARCIARATPSLHATRAASTPPRLARRRRCVSSSHSRGVLAEFNAAVSAACASAR
mmetsp:Transcript_4271/g.17630  ORF Transcript_4271/g.17630 Transcript_4271/m.17630 type:complete len:288 (-) Transcript_4271:601-1464(-)